VSYWLHEAAESELGDAAVYYAEHASRSIAEAFLEEFARVITLLETNQQLGLVTGKVDSDAVNAGTAPARQETFERNCSGG